MAPSFVTTLLWKSCIRFSEKQILPAAAWHQPALPCHRESLTYAQPMPSLSKFVSDVLPEMRPTLGASRASLAGGLGRPGAAHTTQQHRWQYYTRHFNDPYLDTGIYTYDIVSIYDPYLTFYVAKGKYFVSFFLNLCLLSRAGGHLRFWRK